MISILLCEDDKNLNEIITKELKNEGYEVFSAEDGEQGLKLFNLHNIDIVVSDIMMPNIDGYCLAREIRKYNKNVAILFISAKDDKISKQYGYTIGIDDYITKPFDIDELTMKIKAISRRIKINEDNVLVVGNFKMDKEEHMAYPDGEELALTVREFDLLFKLLSYPKKTFTRSSLMEEFWDYDSSATSRTVDVYMAKLRDKTSACTGFQIITVHGLGYKVVLNEKN